MAIKYVLLSKKFANVINQVYPKTDARIVEYNDTTVAATLTKITQDLEGVISSDDVDAKIKAECDSLYKKIIGMTDDTTTINEAYDTLVEVANWITGHGDVVAGMTTDISALKTTVGDATSGLVKGLNDLKTQFEAMEHTKVEASETNGNVKVDGVEVNVYTHPEKHAATMITEDADHRFVTDNEKASWNLAAKVIVGTVPEDASENDLYITDLGDLTTTS